MTAKRTTLLIGAAIFAIVTATFAVNCRNEFVGLDDFEYVLTNPFISRGLTPKSAAWSVRSVGYAANWHPLTWMSHAFDISLAKALGLDWREEANSVGLVARRDGAFARLVHTENVLWHTANAVLLWVLMMVVGRRFHRNRPTGGAVLAAGCALLWALHPLRVEVVAWASERKELLSVFFMLLTLIAYVKGVVGSRSRTVVFSFLFFVLALLAKPVAVSLPAVLFAWELVFEGSSFRRAFRRTWPFLAASAAVCVLTLSAQGEAMAWSASWTAATKVLCTVEAPVVYLFQTVWPFGLSPDYVVPDASSWPVFAAGVLLLVAMAAVCVWWLRRRQAARPESAPYLGWGVFAVAWLYVGLIPMLGIVKTGYEPHNDRYTYWVGCGAAVCLFLVLRAFAPRLSSWRNGLLAAGAVLLSVLAALSVRQSLFWKDTKTLFAYMVPRTNNEVFAWTLSDEYAREGVAGRKRGEEILRDVLQAKRTPDAEAILAQYLAAFRNDDGREARLLAQYALAESERGGWAHAALGFLDWREGKFASAYANMEKAYALGYESRVREVDLGEWKAKAKEEEKGERK